MENLPPVSLVEPSDISGAMIDLCGKSGRFVTATTLAVDAGVTIK